jgi:hypothetical protein
MLVTGDLSFSSFSIAITITTMMSASLAFNAFGLEGSSGFERLSLLPIKPTDLFIAKNVAFLCVVFSHTFFIFPLIFYNFGIVYLTVAVLQTIHICLLYALWGNELSIRFPFEMRFYEPSFGGSIPAMLTAVLSISFVGNIAYLFNPPGPFSLALISLALLAISFLFYRICLGMSSRKLADNWEEIGQKLL